MKGAFTGAIKDRAGRFEAAEGGTIFLDEIGEVPLDMQSKLLRVLHEKLYERVGDDRTRSADVRIIGATNRDLKKAVAAGRFREDLYYRLNVFPIQVLPLRERMDDVPLLAKHFIELSTRELKCDKPRLTRAGVAKLQSYNWPGNVRELRNVIERAVILARGGALDFDLPVNGQLAPGCRTNPRADSPPGSLAQPKFLTEAELQLRERENLAMVLEAANWKIKGPDGAAELLGIKPSTLLSRMERALSRIADSDGANIPRYAALRVRVAPGVSRGSPPSGSSAALVLLLVVSPFVRGLKEGPLYEALLFSLVMCAGLIASRARRKTNQLAFGLVCIALVARWLNHVWPTTVLSLSFARQWLSMIGSSLLFALRETG